MTSDGPGDEAPLGYGARDLPDGWEFKVILTDPGAFLDPAWLREVLEQERRGGWLLVEILSDRRIRLRRPVGSKVADDDLAGGYDPYRIYVESPGRRLVIWGSLAVVGCLTAVGALWLMAALIWGR
jgi:hypothetical protein